MYIMPDNQVSYLHLVFQVFCLNASQGMRKQFKEDSMISFLIHEHWSYKILHEFIFKVQHSVDTMSSESFLQWL